MAGMRGCVFFFSLLLHSFLHRALSRWMKLKPCRLYMVKSGVWLTKMKKSIALRLVTVWTSQSGRSVCRYGAVEEFGAEFASGLLQVTACASESRIWYLLKWIKKFLD